MEARPSKLEVELRGVARELIGVEDAEMCFGRAVSASQAPAKDFLQKDFLQKDFLQKDFLEVPGQWVSRNHVRIVCDGQYFVLIDDSANGTFVQTEDGKTTFLRRADVRLWGQGFLSLGEPPTKDNAIRFNHVD